MAIVTTCPSCGMKSNEWRCPRCNALKVTECSGSCSACATKGGCDSTPGTAPPAEKPASDGCCHT